MGEIKHTPGPWVNKIEHGVRFGAFDCVDRSDKPGTIAIVYGDTDDERMANTKLIAAAPDLLAALKAITSNPHAILSDLVYDVRDREGEGWEGPAVKQWSEAVSMVLEAIQKATA